MDTFDRKLILAVEEGQGCISFPFFLMDEWEKACSLMLDLPRPRGWMPFQECTVLWAGQWARTRGKEWREASEQPE